MMNPVRRVALLSIATSVGTIVLKFGAYYLTGSVSLWSDALESLVNLAAGLVALGALTLAAQPADDRHAYGHDKAEYFSSGVEGALIVVAAVAIIASAVQRLVAPVPLEHLGPGILVAIVASAMNLITSRMMMKVARQHDSITIEADAKHLMTDVWTSVGILIGLAIVMVMPQWAILDPLMAIAVAIHIVVVGIDLLRRSADGLMDAALPAQEVARAESLIRAELPSGASFHALRTRKAGARRFVEFHLLVPGTTTVKDSHELCDRIETALTAQLPKSHVTIHVEPQETQAPHG
jgi:cation diffusion facilitator family transporter